MKNFIFLLILFFNISFLFSQNCVTKFQDADFGLSALTTSYKKMVIEVAPDNVKWFAVQSSLGNGDFGSFNGTTWTSFKAANSDMPDNNTNVNAIAFDTAGNVLVATQNGLAVFDGVSTTGWTIFNTTNSAIPSNILTAVAVDDSNRYWAGTNDGKIAQYNGTSWSSFDIGRPVNTIETGSNGAVWAGLNQSPGIAYYNGSEWITNNKLTNITSIIITENSEVLATSSDSSLWYNFNSVWIKIDSSASYYNLVKRSDNEFFMTTTVGLVRFTPGSVSLFYQANSALPLYIINPIAVDAQGNIWFGYLHNATNYAAGYFSILDTTTVLISPQDPAICQNTSISINAESGHGRYFWSTGEMTQGISISDSGDYHVAVVDNDGCSYYDTTTLFVQKPYDGEKIGLVTSLVIDDETQYNLVIWERTANKGTVWYKIYKETTTADEYELIDSVPFGLLSVYVDSNSLAGTRSERYKISVVDTCGNESELSEAHKTMHLTINIGIENKFNLIWENYEGINFGSYDIYRGTNKDNLQYLSTVPSNIKSYTDDPPAGSTYYYQVRINLPKVISPALFLKASAGPYSQAQSNMEKKLKLSGNQTPVSLSISNSSIDENNAIGDVIGILTGVDPDTADILTYSFITDAEGPHNNYFTIDGNSLKAAREISFERNDTLKIHLVVLDEENASFDTVIVIKVNDINEEPTDISLTSNSIDEGLPAPAVIGILSASDPDNNDVHSFTIDAQSCANYCNLFQILGDTLKTTSVLDFETKSTYSLTIECNDNGDPPLGYEKEFTILVVDVIETRITSNPEQGIMIYPNPVKNMLIIKLQNHARQNTAKIIDSSGKLLGSYILKDQTAVIDVSQLEHGLYVLKIDGVGIMRFVKE
ncbi:cadherin domain-containing protein [Bacteroidota bacterium]